MPDFAPRRFRLVVFDWDGTLSDSTALIAASIQAACADVGQPVPSERDARYVIGLGLADALAHITPALTADGRRALAERYRYHYLAREHEVPLFEGIAPLLESLDDAGYLLAVATGKSRVGLDRVIARNGLAGRPVPRLPQSTRMPVGLRGQRGRVQGPGRLGDPGLAAARQRQRARSATGALVDFAHRRQVYT